MKKSKKTSKKTSKKSSKRKQKRSAPAHSALQTEVIKMIVKKDGLKYPQAMKKLKEHMTAALGKPYADAKAEGMSYIDALKKQKLI